MRVELGVIQRDSPFNNERQYLIETFFRESCKIRCMQLVNALRTVLL